MQVNIVLTLLVLALNLEVSSAKDPDTLDNERLEEIHELRRELDSLKRNYAELKSSNRDDEAAEIQKKIQEKMIDVEKFHMRSNDMFNEIAQELPGKRRGRRGLSDEIMEMQQRYGSLKKEGNHEEAELLHKEIRQKMRESHDFEDFDLKDPEKRRNRKDERGRRRRGRDMSIEDELADLRGMNRHSEDGVFDREDIERDVFDRHRDMTKERVNELHSRIDTVGFTEEEKIALKKEVEEYHELEKKLVAMRMEEKKVADSMRRKGAEREEAFVKVRAHKDAAREEQRPLREAARDKRRDIESKIRERKYAAKQELRF
mmetsp:Transcript_15240/g.15380  ORF Transcript_15240/g.15380 Transcript_15240/m.15380 type:complete len:317 (+) Transcript_15240:77-1027(+)